MREELGTVFKSDMRDHVRTQHSWFRDWNATDYLPSLPVFLQALFTL